VNILDQFRMVQPGWRDILEIALVSVAIYRVLLLIHRTRAMQVLTGLVVLLGIHAVAQVFKLQLIVNLLRLLLPYGAIALLIALAPELRAGLAQLGRMPVSRFFRRLGTTEVAKEVADSVERLSRSGIGAIIVLEREDSLEDYVQSGSEMQAKVSADLLATIFTPYSPLHDGAVIIRGDTIVAASCILPLSQAALLDRALGTRHRAALGLSEQTDATVLVVSEETSAISMAQEGRLWRNLTAPQVRQMLGGESPARITDDSEAHATP
jgi:diadenylate cyclase